VAARPARPLHLEIEAAAILEHRDVLGLVFLASVCSLFVSIIAEHERNSERASQPDENLERAGDGAPSPADDGKGL
jgi:hypothetical protein